MKIVDLHMHTHYSDGEYSPKELIKRAKENGVDIISITDHDSVMAYKEIDLDSIIPGIEVTAFYENTSIHILGYNIDINNKKLNDSLDKVRTCKFYAILKCIDILDTVYKIKLSSYSITKLFNKKGSISRADIASLLVEEGYVDSISMAFNMYLKDIYEYVDMSLLRFSIKEVINLIHEAGGFAVLAHPVVIDVDNLDEFVKKLKELGLDGIEVYHSLHSKDNIEYYLELADKYNLYISGGSDYHGDDIKERIPLSFAKDNNIVDNNISLLDGIYEV